MNGKYKGSKRDRYLKESEEKKKRKSVQLYILKK